MTPSIKRLLTCAALLCAAAQTAPAWAQQKVRLETSAGTIVLDLNAAKAPKTVANFVQYVKSGHYDGTVFHRVIDGFMIQGGGMTPDLQQKPTLAPVPLEASNGLLNQRGTIAMARTMDPNSANAQFFINVKDNPGLDPAGSPDGFGYTVFGKVAQGMDVVDKIKSVRTTSRGRFQDVPSDPILIKRATLE